MKHPRVASPAPAIRKDPSRARKSFAEEVVEELRRAKQIELNWDAGAAYTNAMTIVRRIDRRRRRDEGRKK